MYPEFAYSRAMQLILAGISFLTAYIFIYFIANLILQLYGERASVRQKSIFALLFGVVLDSGWVYLIYIIGGMKSFSDTAYLLIVTSSPIFALLCFCIGIKLFKLSPIRSIKLMGYIYMYFISIKSLSRLVGSIFFVQQPGPYNYMQDAFYRLTFCIVFLAIYRGTQYIIKRYNYVIDLRDNLFINLKKELLIYFIKAALMYLFAVGVPLIVKERIAANVFVFAVFVLSMALTIMRDINMSLKNKVKDNLAHIAILTKGISVTYMGDAVNLKDKINANPSLILILLSKIEYAKKMDVKISVTLLSRLNSFHINNVDVCMVVDCLLDNAIEAAALSEQKKVSFAIKSKSSSEKLIVISNSTKAPVCTESIVFSGITHGEDGIATVRKIASKHGNCIFHLSYYDYMLTAYFAMRESG